MVIRSQFLSCTAFRMASCGWSLVADTASHGTLDNFLNRGVRRWGTVGRQQNMFEHFFPYHESIRDAAPWHYAFSV